MLLCATLVAGTIPGGAFAAAAAQEDSILAPEPIGYANVLDMTGVPEPDIYGDYNRLKLNYKIVGRRAGDIVAIWADPSYANNELGWRAERSLDETLAAAWKWEKHIRGIE